MAVPGMTGAPGMGGAGVASRAPGSPVGVPTGADEGAAKKGVDPKLIGAGAFLAVAGLVAFLVNSSMSGPAVDGPLPPENPVVVPAPPSLPVPPPAPLPPSGGPGVGSAPPPVAVMPFTLVTPPNPAFATGTAGIVATSRNLSPAQAGGLARFAKNQLARGGKWSSMQICVFADPQAAQAFSSFQSKRRGAPLTGGDYQALAGQGVWAGTIAYLDVRGKSERIFHPAGSPNSWWSGLGR